MGVVHRDEQTQRLSMNWMGRTRKEKLAPILSLFTVEGQEEGLALRKQLLSRKGMGHTATIHTQEPHLEERYGLDMAISRVLIDSSGSFGCHGFSPGPTPSATLGSGTVGGSSTCDNVTYRHLKNIRRVTHAF